VVLSDGPDTLGIDPIIERPDGEGWMVADHATCPNRVGFNHPGGARFYDKLP
jgi:hypothetical protein